jgi:hypothetical protein
MNWLWVHGFRERRPPDPAIRHTFRASHKLIGQRFPPRKMPNRVYNAARWGPAAAKSQTAGVSLPNQRAPNEAKYKEGFGQHIQLIPRGGSVSIPQHRAKQTAAPPGRSLNRPIKKFGNGG